MNSLLKQKKASSARQIVQFKSKKEYQKCLHRLKQLKRSLSHLQHIHPLAFIHSFMFPLQLPDVFDALPSIRSIEPDRKAKVHAFPSSVEVISEKPFIPWGIHQIRAPKAWRKSMGEGVHVAVIDTGINYNHPDLRHSISSGINVLRRFHLPIDDNGHGTHIAGTIAASSRGSGMLGAAPQAIIHPVKAFDMNGSAYISDIILGLDWCVRHRIQVINMSFGMKEKSSALMAAIQRAVDAGCIVLASSGNDGKRGEIDYPARFAETISVGATNTDRKIAKFSNRSADVDIYAPGEQILSTWTRHHYNELSGTSMATSHVTGVIALMLAVKPGLTLKQLKWKLRKHASPLKTIARTKQKTAGEVHALRAVDSLLLRKKSKRK